MNVDTGEFAALTGRLDDLAAEVTRLSKHVDSIGRAEAIIRRAGYPESMLYGRGISRAARQRGDLRSV